MPFTWNEGQINVRRNGRYGMLTTSFGLTVFFDWRSAVYVKLPSTYKEAVCGLCGNYNGNRQDDLIPKNGNKPIAAAQFGDSWRVAVIPGCVNGCKKKCPKCDINEKVRYETNNFCGMIRDPSGPFKKCHSIVKPAESFGNCVFDSCLYKGRKDVLCQAISSYVASCQDAGAEVSNWRSSRFCGKKCFHRRKINFSFDFGCTSCESSLYQNVFKAFSLSFMFSIYSIEMSKEQPL